MLVQTVAGVFIEVDADVFLEGGFKLGLEGVDKLRDPVIALAFLLAIRDEYIIFETREDTGHLVNIEEMAFSPVALFS